MTQFNEMVLQAVAWAKAQQDKEEGQGLVEYGLILALIAVICAAALITLQSSISGVLGSVSGALGG